MSKIRSTVFYYWHDRLKSYEDVADTEAYVAGVYEELGVEKPEACANCFMFLLLNGCNPTLQNKPEHTSYVFILH